MAAVFDRLHLSAGMSDAARQVNEPSHEPLGGAIAPGGDERVFSEPRWPIVLAVGIYLALLIGLARPCPTGPHSGRAGSIRE